MDDEKDKEYDDPTGTFIKSHEGYSPEVYGDTKGIPTVGYGANLESPDIAETLNTLNLDEQAIRQGASVDKKSADAIFQAQRAEKERYFDTINKKDFPDSDISENERAALVSMGYNSPRLWGPKLRKMLQMNDDAGVTREILTGSNKNNVPGIQKRRLEEAKMYAGDDFEQIYNSLPPEEKNKIVNTIQQIKNPHERQRVFQQYPFLTPQTRFTKLRQP